MSAALPPENDARRCVASMHDIHKSFGTLEVLKGISMEAREGQVISLIGSSGSGKSTLLRCINLLEIPNSGTLRVGSEELHFDRSGTTVKGDSARIRRIRMGLGMVFQNFNLWNHMTVLDNIIEAPIRVHGVPRAEAVARAEKLLDKVGIYDKRHVHPVLLSGGQQQRAAIARALAIEPQVLLLDEPTSALDPELVDEVLKVIRGLADEGRTMIIVTHEMSFARQVSNHVMFLHKGLVEEEGPPAKVFDAPQSERCRQFVNARSGL